jgi:hypothetical protein
MRDGMIATPSHTENPVFTLGTGRNLLRRHPVRRDSSTFGGEDSPFHRALQILRTELSPSWQSGRDSHRASRLPAKSAFGQSSCARSSSARPPRLRVPDVKRSSSMLRPTPDNRQTTSDTITFSLAMRSRRSLTGSMRHGKPVRFPAVQRGLPITRVHNERESSLNGNSHRVLKLPCDIVAVPHRVNLDGVA